MRRAPRLALQALAFACLAAAPLRAHLVSTGFGTFYDGIAHLFLSPTDLLVVLGLGLLAGLRGADHARPTLFALSGAWLAGGLVGTWFPAGGELAALSACALVLLGALAAGDARLPRAGVVTLALAAGACQGYANGATMGSDRLALLGAVLASFALLTLVSALVVARRVPWQTIAVRVAGSWIAAIGLLLLGWQFRAAG